MPTRVVLFLSLCACAAPAQAGETDPYADGPVVYEGKSAKDWIAALADPAKREKARHALRRLGADALPDLLEAVKSRDEVTRDEVARMLGDLKPTENEIPRFLLLLRNEHFEVRRGAVRVLAPFVPANEKVVLALQQALHDRDRAVGEAAEAALKPLAEAEAHKREKTAELLQAMRELALKDRREEALRIGRDALNLDPNSEPLRIEVERLERRLTASNEAFAENMKVAHKAMELGDWNLARESVQQALKQRPDDPNALRDLVQLERRLEVEKRMKELLAASRDLHRAGKLEEALLLGQQALKVDPQRLEAQDLVNRLRLALAQQGRNPGVHLEAPPPVKVEAEPRAQPGKDEF
ncbi:MAG: hypothetical protein M5U26_00900 [Planctomycetota bacterium]|nr:hypothetical protein [Planctomycetota bacterium]